MIVSVFVRRLKPGRTFEVFIAEWEGRLWVRRADAGGERAEPPVIESTTLRSMSEVRAEHDFTSVLTAVP